MTLLVILRFLWTPGGTTDTTAIGLTTTDPDTTATDTPPATTDTSMVRIMSLRVEDLVS